MYTFKNVYFMCGNFVCIPHVCLSEEGVEGPGTGVSDGYDPLHGFWELNRGSLQEHQVFRTTEPSLQP